MNKKEPTILFNNHRFLFFDALTLKLVPNSAVNTSTTHGASVTLQVCIQSTTQTSDPHCCYYVNVEIYTIYNCTVLFIYILSETSLFIHSTSIGLRIVLQW